MGYQNVSCTDAGSPIQSDHEHEHAFYKPRVMSLLASWGTLVVKVGTFATPFNFDAPDHHSNSSAHPNSWTSDPLYFACLQQSTVHYKENKTPLQHTSAVCHPSPTPLEHTRPKTHCLLLHTLFIQTSACGDHETVSTMPYSSGRTRIRTTLTYYRCHARSFRPLSTPNGAPMWKIQRHLLLHRQSENIPASLPSGEVCSPLRTPRPTSVSPNPQRSPPVHGLDSNISFMHSLSQVVHVHPNCHTEHFIIRKAKTRMGVGRSSLAFLSEVCRPSHAPSAYVFARQVSHNPSHSTAVCLTSLVAALHMNIHRGSLRYHSDVCYPLFPDFLPVRARSYEISPPKSRSPSTLPLRARPRSGTAHSWLLPSIMRPLTSPTPTLIWYK